MMANYDSDPTGSPTRFPAARPHAAAQAAIAAAELHAFDGLPGLQRADPAPRLQGAL
ncbi:MAG: hypothetical protein HXY41_16160 [Chloroflexi bacterium]|nr:hypothetical protein [Chloroflexota bacterium]